MNNMANLVFGALVLAAVCGHAETAWKEVWRDDFNGTSLNEKDWSRIGPGRSDWNRHMSQRPDLVELKDGKLILWGKRNSDTNADPRPFLTGGVWTKHKRLFSRGRIEVCAKFEDHQKGAWPAFWTVGDADSGDRRGWPWNGEIDIVERLNGNDFVHQTAHSAWTVFEKKDGKRDKNPAAGGRGKIRQGEYNVYGLEIASDALVWFVNGQETFRYRRSDVSEAQWPFEVPQHLKLDQQLGGAWVGEVAQETLPVATFVDWVRYLVPDEPADPAPGRLAAPDLTPLKDLVRTEGSSIAVADDRAVMPIVGGGFAAEYLAKAIAETTGVKPPIVGKAEGAAFRLEPTKNGDGSFRIVSDAQGVRFAGNVEFAVFDFCERVLDVRTYHEKGRCIRKTKGLAIPHFSYSDAPAFPHRINWPYEWQEWNRALKNGTTYRGGVQVHAPINWNADKELLKSHPGIFALTPDGRRGVTPLLCYGNPETLAYYQERILLDIAGKRPSGIISKAKKTITVSQWDCGVSCACEHCAKLFREDLGATGSGSPIIWGYFTKELAKWAKKELPGWKIAILPYINTCDVPPGLSFVEEGNVEAELCTMPGLALLKNPGTKEAEENLIRSWVACTGNKVMNWHYSCWPSEFTSAPYVFGKVIASHYRDMRALLVGTFINGPYDTQRLGLSVYVWMKCLWNPDVNVEAVYDGFARRMFRGARGPMRELIRLQEAGWMRPWKSNVCSNRNVYDISYPRADVLKMQDLFAQAERLAADDPLAAANVAWYKGGFAKFFEESERLANGIGYEPLVMKKAVATPIVDGALDDAAWQSTDPRLLVSAKNLKDTKPLVATQARVVWTEEGVTFGFRCEEPDGTAMSRTKNNIEIFFDVTGETGHYCQLILDADNRMDIHTDGFLWLPKGIRSAVKVGADAWTAEVFVPYSDLRGIQGAQIPTSAAGGRYWAGNFIRWREGKSGLDHSRLNTRAHAWNNDAAAFSRFSFIE